MAYDANAKKVAVKVIGTVESNMRYDAINYNDPITVGFVQWYGPRARNILNRMRLENPSSWTGVASGLESQIIADNIDWTQRYLTEFEGNTIIPVLNANKPLQNLQCSQDLDAYVIIAEAYGFNKDANTDAMIYFFTMWHQGPLYAEQVVNECKNENQFPPTLNQIHTQCMLNGVFNQYPGRYNTAKAMIEAGDNSGIELPGDGEPPVDPPDPEPGDGFMSVKYLTAVGNSVRITYSDGQTVDAYPTGMGDFLPQRQVKGVADPDPDPPVDPPDPGTGEWSHPLPGSTPSSPWGPREFDGFHYGDDFSMSPAGNVTAPTEIIIDVADGTSNASAGYYVSARTSDGAYTFKFYHMVAGSLAVSPGQTVPKGTKLGVMGNTGNSFGAHLHFEVYEGALNNPWPPPYGPMTINPTPLLRSHGVTV